MQVTWINRCTVNTNENLISLSENRNVQVLVEFNGALIISHNNSIHYGKIGLLVVHQSIVVAQNGFCVF